MLCYTLITIPYRPGLELLPERAQGHGSDVPLLPGAWKCTCINMCVCIYIYIYIYIVYIYICIYIYIYI